MRLSTDGSHITIEIGSEKLMIQRPVAAGAESEAEACDEGDTPQSS